MKEDSKMDDSVMFELAERLKTLKNEKKQKEH